jgi:hypothetical protein
MYFVFAIGIAYTSHDENAPLLGKLRYIVIIPVIETLWSFSYMIPFFTKYHIPLHVPSFIGRMGEMTIINIGEVSISVTQCAYSTFHML